MLLGHACRPHPVGLSLPWPKWHTPGIVLTVSPMVSFNHCQVTESVWSNTLYFNAVNTEHWYAMSGNWAGVVGGKFARACSHLVAGRSRDSVWTRSIRSIVASATSSASNLAPACVCRKKPRAYTRS